MPLKPPVPRAAQAAASPSRDTPLTQEPASRRRMLAGLGAVGAAGAAVAAMPLVREPVAVVAEAAAEPATPDAGSGYRLTEHIRRYYQTTRV